MSRQAQFHDKLWVVAKCKENCFLSNTQLIKWKKRFLPWLASSNRTITAHNGLKEFSRSLFCEILETRHLGLPHAGITAVKHISLHALTRLYGNNKGQLLNQHHGNGARNVSGNFVKQPDTTITTFKRFKIYWISIRLRRKYSPWAPPPIFRTDVHLIYETYCLQAKAPAQF